MNIACLVNWSMIMRIFVKSSDGGNCLMKSIEIESHGYKGIGSCFR